MGLEAILLCSGEETVDGRFFLFFSDFLFSTFLILWTIVADNA